MIDLDIRERIAGYVNNDRADVGELANWLENISWDLSEEPSRTLVADATRLLAERDHGDWTDDELREHLGHLNRLYWFALAPKDVWLDSAVVTTMESPSSASAGTRRVAASV